MISYFLIIRLINVVNTNIFIYITAILIYFLKNKTMSSINLIKMKIIMNSSLINGVVLIHPFYIYITYSYFIIICLLCKFYYKKNYFLKFLKNNKKNMFLCSLIALFLGGW